MIDISGITLEQISTNANGISAVANFVMALGTIILAYFTYKSILISKTTLESLQNQTDLARKEFENKQRESEKPQIMGHLEEVINPLFAKIESELNQINERQFLWSLNPLKGGRIFLQKSSFEFYIDEDTNTRRGIINYEIRATHPEIIRLCRERHGIFLSLGDLFASVYQKIQRPEIQDGIGKLIYSKNRPHEIPSSHYYDNDVVVTLDHFDFETENATMHDVPLNDFENTIINIRIAELFFQRHFLTSFSDELIFPEYSSYEKDMGVLLKVEDFEDLSKNFDELIKRLKIIDIQLNQELNKIRLEYRETYHLSDKELWSVTQIK